MEEKNSLDKLTWVLMILFNYIIESLVYFFGRRPTRIKELGR